MIVVVISTPDDPMMEALGERMLSKTRTLAGAGRVYRLYTTPERKRDYYYEEVDIVYRCFDTLNEAEDYVRADVAARTRRG